MLDAPEHWAELWADPESNMELRFSVGDRSYYNADISAGDCKLTHYLYDSYSIGNACFGRLTITLLSPGAIPRGAQECTLACRLVSADGSVATDWVPQGTYYLNSVEIDNDRDTAVVTAYDGLALCDAYLYDGGKAPSSVSWPIKADVMVRRICDRTGIGYPDYVGGFRNVNCTNVDFATCRSTLQSIAAAAGGNFTMAKDGKLKFVDLADTSGKAVDAVVSVTGVEQTSDGATVTGVTLACDDEEYTAGSEPFVLRAECDYASQTAANTCYRFVRGDNYQGFAAKGVLLDPLFELGDYIQVEDTREKLFCDKVSVLYEQGVWGSVEAPMRDSAEERIKYRTESERRVNRLTALQRENAAALDTMQTSEYVSQLLERINARANETGGYTYITEGSGIRTYDVPVSDPLVGAEASSVVEVKGGTIRIANSRDQGGAWEWLTVFTSGHIAAELVTAVNIVAGFIGSPSGNYWNLDTGEMRMAGTSLIYDASGNAVAASDLIGMAQDGASATKAAQEAVEVAKSEIGGTNLLIDTDCDSLAKRAATAARKWLGASSVSKDFVSLSADSRPTGGVRNAVRLVIPANKSGTSAGVSFYDGKAARMIDGQDYTLSFWAKRSGGAAKVFMQYGQSKHVASKKLSVATKWKRYSWKFSFDQSRVGGSDGAKIDFYALSDSSNATTVQMCGFKLETGRKATDWSLAPEDTQYGIANSQAIAMTYADAISEADRQYTAGQRAALDASFDQQKVFNRLMKRPGGPSTGFAQGIVLDGRGDLYLNGKYIQADTINAGIIKTGILADKGGKNKWNLATGYFYTKNAEMHNATAKGTLTSGKKKSNRVQFNNGTVRFFYGYGKKEKNALTIDGALKFKDGSYGAHITGAKHIVLRSPNLSVDDRTDGSGRKGATFTMQIVIPTSSAGYKTNKHGSAKWAWPMQKGYKPGSWNPYRPRLARLNLSFINGICVGASIDDQKGVTIS